VNAAVTTLSKRTGPVTSVALQTYARLIRSVLSRPLEAESEENNEIIATLRDVVYRLANQYRSQSLDKQTMSELEDLLMAVHYQHMVYVTKSVGLKELSAKASLTLLKYPSIIPQDKGFYQAGIYCRDIGNTNLAFMLLNR
jgi:intraflagellar transport protein 172